MYIKSAYKSKMYMKNNVWYDCNACHKTETNKQTNKQDITKQNKTKQNKSTLLSGNLML